MSEPKSPVNNTSENKQEFLNSITIRIIVALTVISGLFAFFYQLNRTKVVTVTYPTINSENNSIIVEPVTDMIQKEVVEPKGYNFFQDTRDGLILNKTDFIEVNLTDMILKVWKEGEIREEVKVVAKGKDNSWWETPSGLYKIKNKETNHFSSFGYVYQPWSMVFQGNFFIHGWPYYKGGEPVVSTYSGGCIRLSNEDAESIFSLATVGMPVLVYKNTLFDDGFAYGNKTINDEVNNVSASAYLVEDLNNNFVFYKKEQETGYSVASLTKILTALTAMEYVNLNKDIFVPSEALVTTTKPRFVYGDMVSSYNLLFPLINESSNEAAEIIAHSLGRKRIVTLINEKAQAIGMKNSKFSDSSGVLYDNISTAGDMMALARYLKNDRPFILNITNDAVKPQNNLFRYEDLENYNLMPEVPEFVGGKIGKYTDKESMLAVFKIDVADNERYVGVVVLDSLDAKSDIANLINLVKSKYQIQKANANL